MRRTDRIDIFQMTDARIRLDGLDILLNHVVEATTMWRWRAHVQISMNDTKRVPSIAIAIAEKAMMGVL